MKSIAEVRDAFDEILHTSLDNIRTKPTGYDAELSGDFAYNAKHLFALAHKLGTWDIDVNHYGNLIVFSVRWP